MAIKINSSQTKFNNANGFLPGSRESSQVSGQGSIQKGVYTAHTTEGSNKGNNSATVNLSQVNSTNATQKGYNSTNNSSNKEKSGTSSKPTTKVDETIL